MLLKLVWIVIMLGGEYRQENAKNAISDRLDFEIFWGNTPPRPPKSHASGAFAIDPIIREVWLGPC